MRSLAIDCSKANYGAQSSMTGSSSSGVGSHNGSSLQPVPVQSHVSSFVSTFTTAHSGQCMENSLVDFEQSQKQVDSLPPSTFQMNRQQLVLKEKLGAGNFGQVFRGLYQPPIGRQIPVAVKTLKDDSLFNTGEREILAEAKTMAQLKHRNIVRLIGICRDANFMLFINGCGNCALLTRNNNWHRKSCD
ncbi:Tyrosine-protein kinase ZAP-70 [Cichlidogyrus casuarinus]|uniref:Tyrosine-protein kinase ZAP-70 n=1 Tax=Cichlidogyrus casuarinus TaxID=1844966 RepID=A0ABD2Q6P9_9PLAT